MLSNWMNKDRLINISLSVSAMVLIYVVYKLSMLIASNNDMVYVFFE